MFGRTATFDKLLDKATSNLRLDPDWPTILQICDLIRQGDCPPKYALVSIKKKLYNQNPHSAVFALLVLESIVKNCGHLVHDEVGTKSYMEQLRELVKTTPHDVVKVKALEMIQAWAYAFRSNPKYHAVQDTVNTLKSEGHKFPALKESDAMFSADTAPEWVDASVCHRCRVNFGVVQRKHHCRACGNVFCSQCSSKTSTLPKFGIEKEVRVCEACYDLYNKPRSASPHTKSETDTLPAEYVVSSLAQQNQAPKAKKTEEELKEEEELQLALALSQSEAEAKEKEKKRVTSEIMNNAATIQRTKTPTPMKEEEEEEDPELARYLNRSYWEQRQAEEKPNDKKRTASPDHFRISPAGPPSAPTTPTHQLENGEVSESELNDFVAFLKSQVEIFVNRMKSNSSRGRSISNDSSVQTLFMNVTTNHSRLLKYIHQQDDLRVYYEGLQDKLAQVKDAMMALDALRDEHREKLRREAEEAERLKQLQMAQKLQIMRKKKQEYLQYQRQLAIQKVQEQEREMQMRQEQQKQQYLMGTVGIPQGYMTWDPNMAAMQQQQPPQYQSLPPGYLPQSNYPVTGPSSMLPPQPGSMMPGMVPPGVHLQGPPQVMPPGLQQQQQPPRGAVQPNQTRVAPTQQHPIGPMHNAPLPQMHAHQMPPTGYQGVPMPGGNPQSHMLPQSQSQPLVMPPGARQALPPGVGMAQGPPHNVGMPPGAQPNIGLPPGAQPNIGLPPGAPHTMAIPQGNQQNVVLAQAHPQTVGVGMPQNVGLPPTGQQGQPQGGPQQFQQQQSDNQGNNNTGELISFD